MTHYLHCGPLRRQLGAVLLMALGWCIPLQATSAPQPVVADPDDGRHFRVLAFHDIRDDVRGSFLFDPEESAVGTRTLAALFGWLREAGWHPVSLRMIEAAAKGGPPLPSKAILLTFDDGYKSAYTRAYPLLRAFGYPAVMALVTSWLDTPAGSLVPYGGTTIGREHFLDWNEVEEMARSGLVEFATHSGDLHRGISANPQGNSLPAAAVHRYDPATGTYEDDRAFSARVEEDLRRSRVRIEEKTQQVVHAVVWPYGAYNDLALAAASRAGLKLSFTLEDGPNDVHNPLWEKKIRRTLATYEEESATYAALLGRPGGIDRSQPERAMQVDLDYVYDPDPARQEVNLSRLLDRVLAISPSSVWLQAFADPDGDGVADAVYFPSASMPMRADLFSRVAWQLRTRTGVRVFAWMPVLGWKLPENHPAARRLITAATPVRDRDRYARLSPFDEQAKNAISDIYDDLGRHALFDGVVFHDDALLGDDEDASAPALAVYKDWGLPGDITAIRSDPGLLRRWTEGKTRALNDLTLALAQRLRRWEPALRTARNVYAGPLLNREAEQWFSQRYEDSLQDYDYTAVMAMPAMEEQADGDRWLGALADRAAKTPLGLERTVFELQAKDWKLDKPVPDQVLARQWALLRQRGARNLAYYPDDFLKDQPSASTVRRALSVKQLPGKPAATAGAPGSAPAVAKARTTAAEAVK